MVPSEGGPSIGAAGWLPGLSAGPARPRAAVALTGVPPVPDGPARGARRPPGRPKVALSFLGFRVELRQAGEAGEGGARLSCFCRFKAYFSEIWDS